MRGGFKRATSGRRKGQRFDSEHGVVTESLIFLSELDPAQIGNALEDATHYEPTPLPDICALIDLVPPPYRTRTFVDAGAGMGRVLLVASRYPFKQVYGIEVSRALCEVAKENIAAWREREQPRCRDIRIRCEDALTAPLPHGEAVFYLYNPFGERSLRAFAQRLADRTAETHVLYHTPVHRGVFEGDERFELIGEAACGLAFRKRER